MRGLELPSQSQSREVGTQPELAGVSRQVEVTWPDLLPPLVLEWTETLLVAVDHSSVPWVIGPAGRGSCARSTGPFRYSSTTTSQVDPDGVVRTHRPSAIDRRNAGHGDGCLMITAGNWFDQTSKLTAVIILGGHHKLVMILALTGFGMLAALAPLTDGFTSANRLEVALIIIAWVISIVALAAAL